MLKLLTSLTAAVLLSTTFMQTDAMVLSTIKSKVLHGNDHGHGGHGGPGQGGNGYGHHHPPPPEEETCYDDGKGKCVPCSLKCDHDGEDITDLYGTHWESKYNNLTTIINNLTN